MKLDAGLTRREMQFAELIAWGGASKEVADKLNVTTRTVENTTRNIYKKIGIQKATELAVWWFVKMLGVPIALDPWKRRIIALMLLIIILPKELMTIDDQRRTRRNVVVSRVDRARRNNNNDTLNFI